MLLSPVAVTADAAAAAAATTIAAVPMTDSAFSGASNVVSIDHL